MSSKILNSHARYIGDYPLDSEKGFVKGVIGSIGWDETETCFVFTPRDNNPNNYSFYVEDGEIELLGGVIIEPNPNVLI